MCCLGVCVQQEGYQIRLRHHLAHGSVFFSCVTFHDRGQSTQRMCEVVWIRCNGPCVEEWCLGEVFAEVCGMQFRRRCRVQRHIVDAQDNTLLSLILYPRRSIVHHTPSCSFGC